MVKIEINIELEGKDAEKFLKVVLPGTLKKEPAAVKVAKKVLKSQTKKPRKTYTQTIKSVRPRGRPPKGKKWDAKKGKYVKA